MSKPNKKSDTKISNHDIGYQGGAWVNIMLLAWGLLVVAVFFRHGTLSIIIKVISVLWLTSRIRSMYSGGKALQLFASPTLAGGIILGLVLFFKMPQALVTVFILILAAIIVSTPKYVRNELNKQHD